MTIWLLKETLTPQEEVRIATRTHLALPFGDLPDLAMASEPARLRHLLQTLHPETPPETIARRAEFIWPLYQGLQPEDIIAVPLPERYELALAEVTDRYEYRVGEQGADMHLVPVKWHERRVPFHALSRHAEVLSPERPPMFEIKNPQARIIIRDRLPHNYNRFVKWKWLLALFFLLGMLRMLLRLKGQ